ncbi:hypothetical protein ACFP5Z_18835, partial [Kocuria oceani]
MDGLIGACLGMFPERDGGRWACPGEVLDISVRDDDVGADHHPGRAPCQLLVAESSPAPGTRHPALGAQR